MPRRGRTKFKSKNKSNRNPFDRNLLVITIILTLLGLIIIADASAPQALNTFDDKYYFVKQQLLWAGLGGLAMVFAANINYKFWEKIAVPFFGVSLALLVAVLIPGIGTRALGARRWISLGVFSFQPSEIVKIAMIMYMAKVASAKKELLAYLVPLGVACGLIMLQPDLGTTIIIAVSAMAQIFVAGVNFLYMAVIAGVGGLVSLGLILVSDYRRARLLTFFESTSDPLGTSYHIRQVLFSLGLGGWLGVGIGQSRQKNLFLPEAASDSVFAIVAEEVGFLGALFILALLFYFIYRALKIVINAPDRFSVVLGAGIVAWIGGQMILNISSMVALTPLTGIPLPFISYGGSSLVTILFATGILLNISRYEGQNNQTSAKIFKRLRR